MTAGTKQDPWVLTTPPGTSHYTMYRDEHGEPPALVCQSHAQPLAHAEREAFGPLARVIFVRPGTNLRPVHFQRVTARPVGQQVALLGL